MKIKTRVLITLLIVLVYGCAQQPTQEAAIPVSKPQPEAKQVAVVFSNYDSVPAHNKSIPNNIKPSSTQKKATTDDLWQRLRVGLELEEYYDNPGIEKQVNWYSNSQTYIDRVMQRGQFFLYHIITELEANDMPLELAMLPAVESAFDPLAYSHSHASGLWQFIPGTGSRFGLKRDWWYDGRRDPVASTEAAIQYLKYLHKYFDGDWLLALAAYNSGEGTVRRAIKRNQAKGKPTDFWSLELPRETRSYVPQLLAISSIVANPEKHGIALPDLANRTYFTRIDLPEQIDLSRAAKMANIDAKELFQLNAGYSRRVTHPESPQQILLPIHKAKHFQVTLASTPRAEWAPIKQYVVKSGDTLSEIARLHRVPIKHLRSKNSLADNRLSIGQKLKIPGTGFDSPLGGAVDIYTVRSGDSLWNIAKNKKTSIRDIAKWNSLDVKSPLRPGQKLKVRAGGNSTTTASVKKLRYKVRRGDSLYQIASKFDLKISDILEWNKLNKKNYLQPGQRLTLFVDVLKI
jgi:membrane-bound lytic murein transglycosylase D